MLNKGFSYIISLFASPKLIISYLSSIRCYGSSVGVPGVTWLRVLACGLVGGVERQNSNICINRTFYKYPLLSLALYR